MNEKAEILVEGAPPITVVKDDSLNYSPAISEYNKYEYFSYNSDQGTDATISSSGSSGNHTFTVPSNTVYNLAKSYIQFILKIPALTTTTDFPVIHKDTIPWIQSLSVMGVNLGGTPCLINNFHHWLKIANRYLTSNDDYQTNDFTEWMNPSHVPGSLNKLPATGNNSALDYTDPQFTQILNAGSAAQNVFVNIPFKNFKGTLLATDLDLYWGTCQPIIQINYEGFNKWLFECTSATNPFSGATAFTSGSNVSISAKLFLATCKDNNLNSQIINKVNTTGIDIYIPFVSSVLTRNWTATGSNNLNVNLSKGLVGNRLLGIFWSAFNSTETGSTAYDCDNSTNTGSTSGLASKISSFQTTLNGFALQQSPLTSGTGLSTLSTAQNTGIYSDYMFLKPRLRGSAIQSAKSYYQNWFWVDDFTADISRSFEERDLPIANKIQGMDLEGLNVQWTVASTAESTTGQNYVFTLGTKILSLRPNGAVVSQ